MIQNDYGANTIRLARVTHVHPEGQKLEVIFLDSGDYGRDVQVMSPMAGTDFGFTSGIPSPEEEGHAENMHDDPGKRSITAVVASLQGVHVCLGFLYPQVTQMAFTKEGDKDRLIERHPSDFYRTISSSADADWVHPSGAYVRVGEGSSPDNLEERDFDGRWKLKHNTVKATTITLQNAGSTVRIMPDGTVRVDSVHHVIVNARNSIQMTAGTDIAMSAGGNITMVAGGKVSSTAGLVEDNAGHVQHNTTTQNTSGIHTDARGVHCSSC